MAMGALWDFIVLLIVAGICGFLASQIMGAKRLNLVVLIVLGFVGAFVGRWLAGMFHLPLLWEVSIGGHPFPVIWALIGSMLTVGIASFIMQH
jgi:uncharacterized membrane protein YeaQ/YmgE (transglycosylase-associated protein family)